MENVQVHTEPSEEAGEEERRMRGREYCGDPEWGEGHRHCCRDLRINRVNKTLSEGVPITIKMSLHSPVKLARERERERKSDFSE